MLIDVCRITHKSEVAVMLCGSDWMKEASSAKTGSFLRTVSVMHIISKLDHHLPYHPALLCVGDVRSMFVKLFSNSPRRSVLLQRCSKGFDSAAALRSATPR
jgi:hypothetical protein